MHPGRRPRRRVRPASASGPGCMRHRGAAAPAPGIWSRWTQDGSLFNALPVRSRFYSRGNTASQNAVGQEGPSRFGRSALHITRGDLMQLRLFSGFTRFLLGMLALAFALSAGAAGPKAYVGNFKDD